MLLSFHQENTFAEGTFDSIYRSCRLLIYLSVGQKMVYGFKIRRIEP
jgi:hypothetical protein